MPSCRHCQSAFKITAEDLKFYEKISPVFAKKKYLIPPPTLCPDCRQQRRLAFRNERKLYHRKCDLSGKSVISNFGLHTGIPGYDQQDWWRDQWDAKSFGCDFNFSKKFFDQYTELQKKVPQLALSVWNSENSSYCNYVGNVKNCYLIFGSVYSEDCYYGSPYYSKDCLDSLVIRECEHCYECVDSRKLYECLYCQDCHTSNNLLYCFDVQGSKDCIASAGLRNKQYCVFNEQLSDEAYKNFKKNLDLCDPAVHRKFASELEKLKLKIPHRYMQSKNVENVTGNYIYQSKNVTESYYADRSEDCRFCAQVVDLKDCQDNNYTEENELCYEYLGAYQNVRTHFSKFCNKVSECLYCDSCFTSKNLFGCIGLRNAEYCILNKQYSKEEYEALVPRILEYMEKTNEWGEFFPMQISPFAYNESVASEYFEVNKKEALSSGLQWKEEDTLNRYEGPKIEYPSSMKEIPNDIVKQILFCHSCNKNYKFIEPELKFYRKMNLPLPRNCADCRHKKRLSMRNPRKLFPRTCAKCALPVQTTYSPERPEIVYCEKCYLAEAY